MKLVLASQSPGRKELLSYLNIPFEIIPSGLDEDKITGKTPLDTLKLRSKLKGESVAHKTLSSRFTLHAKRFIILSADSGAILDGKLIGKPKNYRDAVRILQTLSGKTHGFITAVYITKLANSQIPILKTDLNAKTPDPKKRYYFAQKHQILNGHVVSEKFGIKGLPAIKIKTYQTFDRSFVTFRRLTDEDINLYLKNTDYTRFAGGYAIASAQNFITKIDGSVSNVIGLPMEKVILILKETGILH